ncbi:MAG TPA: FHA domain-containing protein, partial [Candidatus Nanopelagicales bacterium]|nr:FHA domain-containing protein [Candidatus Nanopelagicales bacterium]
SHITVAALDLKPPREPGAWEVFKATLTYRPAGGGDGPPLLATLTVPVGALLLGPEPDARAQVLIAQAGDARAEARRQADRGQFEGAAAVLRQMIRTIEAEPGFSRAATSPLLEALEQLVDEAVAMERKPSREDYQLFRKAQSMTPLLVEQPPVSRGAPFSSRMIGSVAGDLPRASLVVIQGDDQGRRHPLSEPRIIIGRTASAHIRIIDANISRQHAVIQAQHGRFLVLDMGSTNTTCLNGVRLSKPTPLAPGDVLKVGDVELRYEEDKKD